MEMYMLSLARKRPRIVQSNVALNSAVTCTLAAAPATH